MLGGIVLAGAFSAIAGLSRGDHDPLSLPGSDAPPGQPIAPGTVLVAGQDVRILWSGSWYDGTVLQPLADGRALVRYDGWGSRWDEIVTLDRLRLP